jgi:hypothetical protein
MSFHNARTAALCAITAVLSFASAGRADFPPSVCDVTFSLENTATLGALQFQVDYSAAGGDVAGTDTHAECVTDAVGGIATWFDDDSALTLHWAGMHVVGFNGPLAIGHCTFDSTVPPDAADFVVTTEDGVLVNSETGNSGNLCGSPSTGLSPPAARDAYVVLRVAVGHAGITCNPCECDTDSNTMINASDSLRILRNATGENPAMVCPACIGPASPTAVSTSMVVTADVNCDAYCPNVPDPTCGTGEKSVFGVTNSFDGGRDSFKWKMTGGPATPQANLGDPLTATTYMLCVYDSTAGADELRAQFRITPNNRWLNKDPKGLIYKDSIGFADGIKKAVIRAGDAGDTQFLVSGKGLNLTLPAPFGTEFFDQGNRVVVQLHNNASAQCWASEYTSNASNTSAKFLAKTP